MSKPMFLDKNGNYCRDFYTVTGLASSGITYDRLQHSVQSKSSNIQVQ